MYLAVMRAADLYQLARELRAAALLATSDPGDSPPSYGELAIVEDVARHPDTTVGEVAARTRLAQSLVSRIVRRLREGGIFVTVNDPVDGRRTLISIDPNVRTGVLQPRGDRSVGPALAATFAQLDEGELARLEAVLEEASQLVRKRHT
jgi:DNA-binding MarR family transcriptional regulator